LGRAGEWVSLRSLRFRVSVAALHQGVAGGEAMIRRALRGRGWRSESARVARMLHVKLDCARDRAAHRARDRALDRAPGVLDRAADRTSDAHGPSSRAADSAWQTPRRFATAPLPHRSTPAPPEHPRAAFVLDTRSPSPPRLMPSAARPAPLVRDVPAAPFPARP